MTRLSIVSSDFQKNIIDGGYDIRSGVLAVADNRIEMQINEYGEYESVAADKGAYSNPKVILSSAMSDESPDEDEVGSLLYSTVDAIKHDDILGYYLNTYAGYVVEGDYRKLASSGGIATWLIKELMKLKLIDGVIHVKKSSDGDGVLFKYGVSTTIEEVIKGAKSRYYPCEMSLAIKEALAKGGRYAVVGIPSFIMEVRLLAEQDPEIKKLIPYAIGLVCGHQKSMKYSDALAWQYGIKPGCLKDIDYRLKVEGQPSSRYITKMIGTKNGQEVELIKDQDELFVSNWGHGQFKTQFSDYSDDAFNETADITLGDAWLPEYTKDSGGTNVIVTRHPVIDKIIKEGQESGSLYIDNIRPERVIKSQSGLVHHMRDELGYRLWLKDRAGEWRPKKRYEALHISNFKKSVQKTRLIIRQTSRSSFKTSQSWDEYRAALLPAVNKYKSLYSIRRVLSVIKNPRKVLAKIVKKIKF